MTIRHLKVYVKVCEHNKISTAARELYIAQSSVSQAIQEIEEHYGGKMFERLSHKLYITPLGQRLWDYAVHLISLYDQMELELTDAPEKLTLCVGATVTIGTCVMPGLIKDFTELVQEAKAHVMVANTHDIEGQILLGALDIAIVEGTVKSEHIRAQPIIQDKLVLVCAPEHPFAARERIAVSELSQESFILRETGSGTRETFLQQAAVNGVTVKEAWACYTFEAIKAAVMQNIGVTVISRMLVEKEVEANTLVAVEIEGLSLERSFSLIYHKNKFLSPVIKSFIACAQEYSAHT